MSSAIRSIARRRGEHSRKRSNRSLARALAKRAAAMHEEGIAIATDHLGESLREMVGSTETTADREYLERALRITVRPVDTFRGVMDMAAITERADSGEDVHHIEVTVATRQDDFRATDSAAASMVVWRTKVATIITEDDGSQLFTVLWERATSETVKH